METAKVITDTARQFGNSQGLRVLTLDAGDGVDIGSTRVRFLACSDETGGGFSLIEYPIPPRTLVAPMHRHSREDEYSFVFEGRMATILGDQVVYANAGDLTFKPRGQWHTVWNPDAEPSRILEIISPGGFERFFEEFAASLHQLPMPPVRRGDLGARYGVETDYESVRRLCAEHGLHHPLLRVGRPIKERASERVGCAEQEASARQATG